MANSDAILTTSLNRIRPLLIPQADMSIAKNAAKALAEVIDRCTYTAKPVYHVLLPFLESLSDHKYKGSWKEIFPLYARVFESFRTSSLWRFLTFGNSHEVDASKADEPRFDSFTLLDARLYVRENPAYMQYFCLIRGSPEFNIVEQDEEVNRRNERNERRLRLWILLFAVEHLPTFSPLLKLVSQLIRKAEDQEVAHAMKEGGAASHIIKADAVRHVVQLRKVVGAALRCFGLEVWSSQIPLNLTKISISNASFSSLSNSWMLPILERHGQCDSLLYFTSNLLPMVWLLYQKSKDTQSISGYEARNYRRLAEQIWGLLPRFFMAPLDLDIALEYGNGSLRRSMAETLNDPVIRPYICQALVNVCSDVSSSFNEYGNLVNLEESLTAQFKGTSLLGSNATKCIHAVRSQRNAEVLRQYAQEFVGMMVMNYMKLGEEGISASITEHAGGSSVKAAQHLTSAIDAYAPFCSPATLQQNTMALLTASENKLTNNSLREAGTVIELTSCFVAHLPDDALGSVLEKYFDLFKLLTVQRSAKRTRDDSIEVEGAATSNQQKFKTAGNLQSRLYHAIKLLGDRIHSIMTTTDEVAMAQLSTPNNTLFRANFINNLWTKLHELRHITSISATKARLKCLRLCVSLFCTSHKLDPTSTRQLWQEIFPKLIPEVLIASRESNSTVRKISMEIVLYMTAVVPHPPIGTKVTGTEDNSLQFVVSLILAALTGKTARMKAASVSALAMLLKVYGPHLCPPPNQCCSQLSTCVPLLLLKDKNLQVFKSALFYARACVAVMDQESVDRFLPQIIHGTLTSPLAQQTKLTIRRSLEKLIRKFGIEKVRHCVPVEHHALVAYIDKAIRRKSLRDKQGSNTTRAKNSAKRTVEESSDEEDNAPSPSVKTDNPKKGQPSAGPLHKLKELLIESDSGSDSDSEDETSTSKREQSNQKTSKRLVRVPKGSEATDFLSSEHTRNAVILNQDSTSNKRVCRASGKDRGSSGSQNIYWNEEGKLVVPEANDIKTVKKPAPRDLSSLGKQKLDRVKEAKTIKSRGHYIKSDGAAFRSRKGGGDSKRKGTTDPFAYLQLNKNMMKEKNKSRALGSFANIVGRPKLLRKRKGLRKS